MKVGSRLGHPGEVLVGLLGEKGTAAILRADVGVDHNVALLRFADLAFETTLWATSTAPMVNLNFDVWQRVTPST